MNLPDQQIHTLEHGAIVYQYRPDDVQDADVEALVELADEFGSHVLVAPNPALDAPFVATAWTRRLRLDEVDIDKARDFGVAFTGKGPESVACPLNQIRPAVDGFTEHGDRRRCHVLAERGARMRPG